MASESFDPFETLRNDFNFAYVCEFLHHFGAAFFRGQDDTVPSTPSMEQLLIYEEDPKKICHVYLKLLKGLPSFRFASAEHFFEGLAKEFKRRDLDTPFPNPAPPSAVLTLSIPVRLLLLRCICDFLMENADAFAEVLAAGGIRDQESDWRIEPVSEDAAGRRYWVLSDGRLYRERTAASAKKTKTADRSGLALSGNAIVDETNWELVCISKSDYEELFGGTRGALTSRPRDRALLKLVREIYDSQLLDVLAFQLSQHKKIFQSASRDLFVPRKRSSRLLEKEIEAVQKRESEEAIHKEQERLQAEQQRLRLLDLEAASEREKEAAAAEREQRAEQRRMKRERELQIKAIEEAYFAQQDDSVVVDIVDEDKQTAAIDAAELAVGIDTEPPKSPIRIVFKLPSIPAAEPGPVSVFADDACSRQDQFLEPHSEDDSAGHPQPDDPIAPQEELGTQVEAELLQNFASLVSQSETPEECSTVPPQDPTPSPYSC